MTQRVLDFTHVERERSFFLVACYATLYPALSVRRLVGRLVGPLFTFSAFLSVLSSLLLPKCPSDLLYHCPCPPARDQGSRVSGLVWLDGTSVEQSVGWSVGHSHSWSICKSVRNVNLVGILFLCSQECVGIASCYRASDQFYLVSCHKQDNVHVLDMWWFSFCCAMGILNFF